MPIYEYDCPQCGDFTVLRPMAERDEPCACPYCDTQSARVILSAPGLATLPGSQRRAHETNERARHAPHREQVALHLDQLRIGLLPLRAVLAGRSRPDPGRDPADRSRGWLSGVPAGSRG